MSVFTDVVAYFTDSDNWTVSGAIPGIPVRVAEHIGLTALPIVIALVIAVPVGAMIGHTGRGGFLVVGSANGLRSLPEIGVLYILVSYLGVNSGSVTGALVVLAIPPLLAGTYAGVSNVDRSVVDAARGMGMTEREILTKVELPNALPLIVGGLRTATLQVVATAAIAAFVGVGGLGRYIVDGLAVNDYTRLAVGALLIAVLALSLDAALAGVQRLIVSPGLRRGGPGSRRTRPTEPSPLPESTPTPIKTLQGADR